MSVRSRATKERLFAQVDNTCVYCCTEPTGELDHIRPRSRRGPNALANLAPVCSDCAQAKGAFTVREWIAWEVLRARAEWEALPWWRRLLRR